MNMKHQITLEPRKMPVQARSTVTVEAIYEATIQVLLAVGADRMTTTRVAERAGVSVGTLYQYFPNKQSLLLSVLERHMDQVVSTVEFACRRNHGQPVSIMIESVVKAFVDAKLERPDISMALYAIANGIQDKALMNKAGKRTRAAIASMLATAPNINFADLPFTSLMLMSVMGGATKAVLEAGAPPRMVRLLRKQLVLLCQAFLMSVADQD
jgi:AcrR family transcriptional regulator